MRKSGWLIGVLVLPVAACSNSSNGGTEGQAGKSGLSSTLVLSAATDAQKLQFCNWLASVAPTNACGAPSASSADGGAPAATDGGASTATAQCLATFTKVTGDCTVEVTEQCFSSWEASGSCQAPATASCVAYTACVQATPPTNGPDTPTSYNCYPAWSLTSAGTIDVELCNVSAFGWLPATYDFCGGGSYPVGLPAVAVRCNSTYPKCNDSCSACILDATTIKPSDRCFDKTGKQTVSPCLPTGQCPYPNP